MNKKLTYGQKVFWSDLAKLQDCTVERAKKIDSDLVINFKKPIARAEKIITPIISNWLFVVVSIVLLLTAKIVIETLIIQMR